MTILIEIFLIAIFIINIFVTEYNNRLNKKIIKQNEELIEKLDVSNELRRKIYYK